MTIATMKDSMLKGPTPYTFPGGFQDLIIAMSSLDTSDENNLFGGNLECRSGISAAALPLPSTAAMDHRYLGIQNLYIICSDLCSSSLGTCWLSMPPSVGKRAFFCMRPAINS